MTLKILTPKTTLPPVEVTSVVFPGVDGSFEVLRGHAPLIAALGPGEILFVPCDEGEKRSVAITSGFVKVQDNTITVAAEQ